MKHKNKPQALVYIIPYYRSKGALAYIVNQITRNIWKYINHRMIVAVVAQREHYGEDEVIFLPERKTLIYKKSWKRRFEFINLLIALFRVSCIVNIKVLHAFFAYPSGIASVLYSLIMRILLHERIPVVITVAGEDVEIVTHIRYGKCLNPLIKLLIMFALRNASIVIAPSKYASLCIRRIVRINNERIIPYGVNIGEIQRAVISLSNRTIKYLEEKGLKKHSYILSLCRLHPKKGLMYLIYAFKYLISNLLRSNRLMLVIAGEGQQKEYLVNLVDKLNIKNRVLFLGYVSEDVKQLLLNNCLCYVLPSLSDVFALSLIEALAHEAVVIATNKIGASELLLRYGYPNELIVKPQNVISLAHALFHIITCREELKIRIASIYEQLIKAIDISNMIKGYARVYNSLLGR